jgi:tol-pal system protein YbgF
MYASAWADYTAGQWTLAISGFQAYLRTFSTTEMADDAQFFIGEAQYAQNKFDDAVAAYNAVIQNYPMGDQVPMAYYKRGLAQERLGQTDAARASFDAARMQFPDSDGGRLADQRIKQLDQQPAPTPQR